MAGGHYGALVVVGIMAGDTMGLWRGAVGHVHS